MKVQHLISAALAGALLAGCAANGTSVTPNVTQANLASNTLQFAVGTANIGSLGTVGLNTVVTYRQPSGASAVLTDTPTITGPATFAVPVTPTGAACANTSNNCPWTIDSGTNHISGVPQTFNPSVSTAATFATSGGAFGYGFGPYNSSSTGASVYVGSPSPYRMPFYSTSGSTSKNLRYIGGPPAYPFFNDGTYPTGFLGYLQGFTDYNAAPVAGSYSLNVGLFPQNAPQQNVTASATLTDITPLPALAPPTFVPNVSNDGGATGTVTVPADARIVETLVYVVNLSQNTYFTAGPFKGNGQTFNYTLPNNLGLTCNAATCAPSPAKGPTFQINNPATGVPDTFRVYAVSYDYPAFEASLPVSTSASPAIKGANGQADITSSAALTGNY